MKMRLRTKMQKKVTISREEYKMLKERSKVDWNLVNQIKRSLEDIKNSRMIEWKSSKQKLL
ncbi:MAG: hypothetical protein AABW45_02265 [Nanoarchaeota archaeon]